MFRQEVKVNKLSYPSNRRHVIGANGTQSPFVEVNCGVTQGSILGHILILIVINDFSINGSAHFYIYADDTTIINTGHDLFSLNKIVYKSFSFNQAFGYDFLLNGPNQ